MLKSANEIAIKTKEAQKSILVKRHEDTMNFIQNDLAKGIMKAAAQGETTKKFKIDAGIDRDTVVRVLEGHGYRVNGKGCEIYVDWWNAYFYIKDDEEGE